jgi:hypothetical protein
MLNEYNLPNYILVEAVAIVVYIMNWTPTVVVHGMTPEEKFTSKKLDVSHLRCLVALHICMFLMQID